MIHNLVQQIIIIIWLLLVAGNNSSPFAVANPAKQATTTDHEKSDSHPRHEKCETLKTSLTYSQENAPQDISGVLPLIVERVNRELSGVVDVEVLFTGSEIHRRVGKHEIQCSVTRLLSAISAESSKSGEYQKGIDEQGREVVTQCFLVPFTILDVDECKVPLGHSMRHKCVNPAMCVNTEGSYECVCPKRGVEIPTCATEAFWKRLDDDKTSGESSPWELSLGSSLQSTCPSKSSTHGCCETDAHGKDGEDCRAGFRCPLDPCQRSETNTCVSTATCVRADNPLDQPQYKCVCPEGLMGNGHKCRKGIDPMPVPKVKFDGVTPTDETKKNNMYCSCTKPVVDPCAGFPKCQGKNEICTVTANNEPICACKPGYVKVENFGCVDEKPPVLKLRHDPRGDGITRLKQGDSYKEYAVDVIDDNAEDYLRSLKIAYSRPLPPGCLVEMGSFQVNYTVAMPWANPPYARATREVIIEDIDECKLDVDRYETQCPQLIPHCDTEAGAVCKNTIGSYTCQCPQFTTGDGFKFISSVQKEDGKYIGAPVGYKGGTGCRDTSKPTIKLLGPNPKVFRTCKFGGLSGIMRDARRKKNEKDEKMLGEQRKGYEEAIVKMIKDTGAAELCATHTKQNPSPIDCVAATDRTYKGNVDLSSKVTVGSPVQVSGLEWKVPYNVMDEAGNAADTVWRHIVVEEVSFNEMEEKIRSEVLAGREKEIKEAVRSALEAERRNRSNASSAQTDSKVCPTCPPCVCPVDGKGLSLAECDARCGQLSKMGGTCEGKEYAQNRPERGRTLMHSFLDYFIDLTEGVLSPNFAGILLLSFLVVFLVFILQRIFVVNQSGWQYFDARDEQREKEMLNQVTYFNGRGRDEIRSPTFMSPPSEYRTQSLGAATPRSSIFSPPDSISGNGRGTEPRFATPRDPTGSIYNERYPMSPLTPGARTENQQSVPRDSVAPYNLRRRY